MFRCWHGHLPRLLLAGTLGAPWLRPPAPATDAIIALARVQTMDRIKQAGALSEAGRSAYEGGVNPMQSFCGSTNCRHALLVNFFHQVGSQAPAASCP